MKTSAQLLSI